MTLRDVIGLLAGGEARIVLDDEGYPELLTRHGSVSALWDQLCREGWLESMPNGGTFKLSDAGLLAYLRSTDELGDGQLVSPLVSKEAV
jgi:hypothetical protein